MAKFFFSVSSHVWRTLLEAGPQTSIVVCMEVGEEPMLAVWRCLISFATKLVHYEASARYELPVRQPQRP